MSKEFPPNLGDVTIWEQVGSTWWSKVMLGALRTASLWGFCGLIGRKVNPGLERTAEERQTKRIRIGKEKISKCQRDLGACMLIEILCPQMIHYFFTILTLVKLFLGIPGGASGKEPSCRRYKRCGFNPWVWKIPWRRPWQPIPVFMDRGAWQATVHRVAKSRTQIKQLSLHTCKAIFG